MNVLERTQMFQKKYFPEVNVEYFWGSENLIGLSKVDKYQLHFKEGMDEKYYDYISAPMLRNLLVAVKADGAKVDLALFDEKEKELLN